MNIVGLEEITAFKDNYEFKLFSYDGEINLSNNENFICNLEIIIQRVESIYLERLENDIKAIVLVKEFNDKFYTDSIVEDIKDFVLDEIIEENLCENNIEVVFIKS